MGTVSDLKGRRNGKLSVRPGQFVVCAGCGERHPVIRMAGGTVRCVTAFADGEQWFCRNRGCRAAWLSRNPTT
jgi:hypothetical protein